jgi:hypothetical protein
MATYVHTYDSFFYFGDTAASSSSHRSVSGRNKGPVPFGSEPSRFRPATLPLLLHNVPIVLFTVFALRQLKHGFTVPHRQNSTYEENPQFVEKSVRRAAELQGNYGEGQENGSRLTRLQGR